MIFPTRHKFLLAGGCGFLPLNLLAICSFLAMMTPPSSQPTQLPKSPCLDPPQWWGCTEGTNTSSGPRAFPLRIQILPLCSQWNHSGGMYFLPPFGRSRDPILYPLPTHSPNGLRQVALRESSRDGRKRPNAYWRKFWDGKMIEVIREDDSHGPIPKVIFGFDIAGTGKKTGWVSLEFLWAHSTFDNGGQSCG